LTTHPNIFFAPPCVPRPAGPTTFDPNAMYGEILEELAYKPFPMMS
jgi:hypothetical protein